MVLCLSLGLQYGPTNCELPLACRTPKPSHFSLVLPPFPRIKAASSSVILRVSTCWMATLRYSPGLCLGSRRLMGENGTTEIESNDHILIVALYPFLRLWYYAAGLDEVEAAFDCLWQGAQKGCQFELILLGAPHLPSLTLTGWYSGGWPAPNICCKLLYVPWSAMTSHVESWWCYINRSEKRFRASACCKANHAFSPLAFSLCKASHSDPHPSARETPLWPSCAIVLWPLLSSALSKAGLHATPKWKVLESVKGHC